MLASATVVTRHPQVLVGAARKLGSVWHSDVMSEKPARGDRGGGIRPRGDFRIRDFHLSFDGTTGELVESSFVNEVRTDIFGDWLRIAADAARDAEEARLIALDADAEDNHTFTDAFEREFRASMTAIAAAAFAIDSFYGSVLQRAPETKVPAKSRAAAILETLKRAFSLNKKQQASARKAFRMIFSYRDLSVHPRAAWEQPVLHPVYNLGMASHLIRCRAENAINAAWFAAKLSALCLRCPRSKYPELVEWCEALADRFPEPEPRLEWEKAHGETVIV
jgi:hypothetical protein